MRECRGNALCRRGLSTYPVFSREGEREEEEKERRFCPHVALVVNSRNCVKPEDQPAVSGAKQTRALQLQHHNLAPSLGASLETHMQKREGRILF